MNASGDRGDVRAATERLLARLHDVDAALGDLIPPTDDGPTDDGEGRRVWRVEIEHPAAAVHLVADEDDARLLADEAPGNAWVEAVPVLDHDQVVAMIDRGSW